MSAVPPTHFRTAPLLPAGELGCERRALRARAFEGLSLMQRTVRQGDTPIQLCSLAGELGCGFRHLCSPHSLPQFMFGDSARARLPGVNRGGDE